MIGRCVVGICGFSAILPPLAGAIVPAFFCSSVAAEQVPRQALQWQRELTRNVRSVWGLDAPIALFAAQIHQESGWRADARSQYANGIAQFTPGTATWLSGVYHDLGEPQPTNPAWAMRALSRYDKHLYDSLTATTDCDRWAFTLSAYNGGISWVNRDRAIARASRDDDDRYWGHVERYNSGRAPSMFLENRMYPLRIMMVVQPVYAEAGWGRGVLCLR